MTTKFMSINVLFLQLRGLKKNISLHFIVKTTNFVKVWHFPLIFLSSKFKKPTLPHNYKHGDGCNTVGVVQYLQCTPNNS